MHFEGIESVRAPKEALWKFLTKIESVSQCVPGVESIDIVDPDKEFNLVVTAKLGSISPTFKLNVVYVSFVPPTEARLRIQGSAPGTRLGVSSYMKLTDGDSGATEMKWSFDVTAFGLIANVGERVIDHVFQQVTGRFIACVKSKVEAL